MPGLMMSKPVYFLMANKLQFSMAVKTRISKIYCYCQITSGGLFRIAYVMSNSGCYFSHLYSQRQNYLSH